MIDLFGIKAKQTNLNHLRRITELEDELTKYKQTCELQAQIIDHLKNDTAHLINDIDFPNSKGKYNEKSNFKS